MAALKEIKTTADKLFKDTYSVKDILVGDTIAMHKECMNRAIKIHKKLEKKGK